MLVLEKLDVFAGSMQILDSISLEVGQREIAFLVGRNGAGKSSILKAIMGIYPVKRGRILFQGRDITWAEPFQRARLGIGYSPETGKVFSALSVEENIKLGMWALKIRDSGLERIFKIFPEVKKLLRRRASCVSGGEKKMVSIARALAMNPSLLLLDGAFEGLAPGAELRLARALKEIREELGISMVLAEARLRLALPLAHKVYLVEGGRIVFEGKPQELLEDEKLLKIVGK